MKGIQLVLLGMMMLALPSCYFECDSQAQAPVGGEFFTVTYLDATGGNYLTSVYQPSGIVVYLDTTGGEDPSPEYELINPGYADGKFGPFPFTERYIDPTNEVYNDVLLFGRQYNFDYYIRKDTYGVDTIRVSFLLDVDECGSFWRSIRYSRNGDPLPAYDNVRQADIIIVE
jgi:hypothetical protein